MRKDKICTIPFLPSSPEKIYFNADKNSILVFYTVKENKKRMLRAASLLPDFSWTSPVTLDSFPTLNNRSGTDFVFTSSEDKTKTLTYKCYTENNTLVLHAQVVDNGLQVLNVAERVFTEPGFFISENAVVSNEGTAHIIATDRHGEKGPYEMLTLLSIKKGERSGTLSKLNVNTYFVNDLHIKMDEINHNVYVCSYFSEGKYGSERGIYYSVFSEESRTQLSGFFTPLTLQNASGRTDLRDLSINDIFLTKKGEIEICAEKTFQNSRTLNAITPALSSSFMMSNMADNARIVQEYSYDEIVLFHFKVDGSLAWSQTILKEQTTTDDHGIFSSYGVLQHKLGKVLFFNDLSSRQSRLLCCYVSGNGEFTVKEVQLLTEADNWDMMPRSAMQLSKSEIVIPCVSKSYLRFLKISY